MFSAKNLSPQQLSAFTAGIIALPISVGIYFFKPVWWVALTALVIIFIGAYGLVLFMVWQFFYMEIKKSGIIGNAISLYSGAGGMDREAPD